MTKKIKNPESINERISTLTPRLSQIARQISKFSPEHDEEDMLQIMYQALLERNNTDPTFYQQTDSYILKYASFMGRHAASKAQTYLKYVDEEGFEIDPEDAEDKEYTLDLQVTREKIFAAIANVEVEVMKIQLGEQITEGYKTLTIENKAVVYMLYMGYRQTEIAETLSISKPAVSQRINTIKEQLKDYVANY